MFYILKVQERRDFKQEKREETYQVIIAELTDRLNLVVEIKEKSEILLARLNKANNKFYWQD